MNVIVCVKQVPDPNVLKFNIKIKSLEDFHFILNPYDKVAIEEAIRTREKVGGEVTAISLGPSRVTEVLRASLTMGADKAIHLKYEGKEDLDAYATSYLLADFIKTLSYDLILCGRRSIDADSSYVGLGIAHQLDIPAVCEVTRLELSPTNTSMTVHRREDKGDRVVLECPLPAVLTVDDTLNEPRYPSLPTYMAGIRKEIIIQDMSFRKAPRKMKVVDVTQPKPRLKKEIKVDSNLSPLERMKLIMSVGTKEKTKLIEKNPDEAAYEAIRFMEEVGII